MRSSDDEATGYAAFPGHSQYGPEKRFPTVIE